MYFLAEGPRRFVRHLGQVFRLRHPRPFSPSRIAPVACRKRALPLRRRLRWGFAPRFPVRPPPGGTSSPYSVAATGYHKTLLPSRAALLPPRRQKRRAGAFACPPFIFLSERQRIYFSTFSMKRLSIAAACARVASPRGSRRPLSSPRSRPAPTAQFIAGTA